jgi:hypothetical protein
VGLIANEIRIFSIKWCFVLDSKRLSHVENTTKMTTEILSFWNPVYRANINVHDTVHCAACYGGLCTGDQSTKKSPRLPSPKLTAAPMWKDSYYFVINYGGPTMKAACVWNV